MNFQKIFQSLYFIQPGAVVRRCFMEMVSQKILQNSQEITCETPEACNFLKIEPPAQMFPCEFCETFKSWWLLLYITYETTASYYPHRHRT